MKHATVVVDVVPEGVSGVGAQFGGYTLGELQVKPFLYLRDYYVRVGGGS